MDHTAPNIAEAECVWCNWLQGLGNRRKLKDVHMPGLTAGKDWDTEIQQWQRKMQEWQADAKKHHW